MSNAYGSLILISGPSGVGKTTLIECTIGLINAGDPDREAWAAVSHTTRPARSGEADGEAYHFVPAETFEAMCDAGEFLEHAEVFGHRYGCSRTAVLELTEAGHDALRVLDVRGHAFLRREAQRMIADGQPIRRVVSVFIKPPSMAELHARLVDRGMPAHERARRLAEAPREMSHESEYDLTIVNDNLLHASTCLTQIILMARRLDWLTAQRQVAGPSHAG